MFEVKAQHGITVVQDPAEAVTPNMPQSVIDNVTVDHIVPADQIAALLTRLVAERQPTRPDAIHATGDSQENGMTAEFTLNHPVAVILRH
jgi:two-component system chemotaxis response regulator CheB